ncbi:hypothetical protein JCM19235_4352 [Vibrio maritimus]|uniref:Uncharacterized protein n=1 Tax=Vibrio maritimus TaxID=990268 RepID=A0A090SL69_9VIBR|nr:hypothetical protein JCM19235_4352 [Vibrio maritimus]
MANLEAQIIAKVTFGKRTGSAKKPEHKVLAFDNIITIAMTN